MESILEFMKDDMFVFGLTCFSILLFILYLINLGALMRIKRDSKDFMKKLGNGENIKEILDKHIDKINKVVTKNEELEKFCVNLDRDIKYCIQKVRNLQI